MVLTGQKGPPNVPLPNSDTVAGGDTFWPSVPKQAMISPTDSGYELSHKLSRPMDLRWICWAVSFSMTTMAPPQSGQRQEPSGGKLAVVD